MTHPHDDLPSTGQHPEYPPGFRARRGLNWGFVGLLYASYYLCRYNFPIANEAIGNEFHYDKGKMGWIISVAYFAYAIGQIVNGLLTDRLGGKRAMLIGAAGTIVLNILFGVASFWGLFGLFLAIRGIDGYMQSFGAPGMIKINAAWFHRKERGRFAGIFGFMINIGRWGINSLGPAILGGVVLVGVIRIPPQHWRWVFWIPAVICAIVAVLMATLVKETPEGAGFSRHDPDEPHDPHDNTVTKYSVVIRKIATNPAVWVCALAYACTGAVRHGLDQWFPRFMSEVHSVDYKSVRFATVAFLIPLVATLGSLISGYVSDLLFNGRRAPVAAALYLVETAIILTAAMIPSINNGLGGATLGTIAIQPHGAPIATQVDLSAARSKLEAAKKINEAMKETSVAARVNPDHDSVDLFDASDTAGQLVVLDTRGTSAVTLGLAGSHAVAPSENVSLLQKFLAVQKDPQLDTPEKRMTAFTKTMGGSESDYARLANSPTAPGRAIPGVALAMFFLVLIAFTANSTHSIIGTAAAMDIGGRKMAGFASGCIDSFQYFGASLAGFALGSLIEKNWGNYFYFMAPFGIIGAALMFFFRNVVEKKTKREAPPAR